MDSSMTEEADAVDNDAFYALLNVPKDASSEAIRQTYRQIAVLLHPDKQTDESQRKTANERFERVKKAYEVLSDPHLRAVYDALGEAGLQYSGVVGEKYKSASEVIAEIERLARLKNEPSSAPGNGLVTCVIDARPLNLPYAALPLGMTYPSLARRIQAVSVANVSVRHSVQAKISESTQVVLTGRVAAKQGGRGSLVGTVKHQFSPRLAAEATIGLLHPHSSTLKASYGIDSLTELNVVARSTPGQSLLPSLAAGISRVLYPGIIGTIMYNTGWPPIGTSLAVENANNTKGGARTPSGIDIEVKGTVWSSGINLSGGQGILAASWNNAYSAQITPSTNVSFGATLALGGGMALTLSGTQSFAHLRQEKLHEHSSSPRQNYSELISSITAAVVLGSAGLELRIKIVRLGQVLVIPIKLTDQIDWTATFWTTLIPSLGLAANEYFILAPARMGHRRLAEVRARHMEALNRRRDEAQQEIELMREQIGKRVEVERKNDGLVITRAEYGPASRGHGLNASTGLIADVTIPVQALVHGSQLSIQGGRSKALLIGFHDPCYGERKSLTVHYTFKGKEHFAVIADEAAFAAPVRGHAVN